MEQKLEYLSIYLKTMAGVSFLCALLEVFFLFRFHGIFWSKPVSSLELGLVIAFVFLFLVFAAVAIGLLYTPTWFHGIMIFMSALGTILLIAALVFGALFGGGLIGGLDTLTASAFGPLGVNVPEVLLLVLPFIILFNPYNLYLFLRSSTLKSLFLPPQKEAPALKRPEL